MRLAGFAILVAATTAGPLSAQRARTAAPVDAQSIRVGGVIVVRPFGAELVDRLVTVGSYRLGGRRVHLVRGETGGACPARFVFVSEQARAAPSVSTPFGTCGGAARVRLVGTVLEVTIAAAPDGKVARFAFDGVAMRPLDADGSPAVEQCPPAAHVDPVTQAEAVAAFERGYPDEFRSRRAAGRSDIDGEEMRSLVITMACLAPWPAAENKVPSIATPLFASHHGRAAFAALAGVAEDPDSGPHLRASARSFAAEMNYRLARREPL